jgi:peptidoglycan/LPS O-acetylase OafA/YrhL
MLNSRSRITQLDGLRACAIAAVFLHHAYHVKLLWIGVDLFFVLSGFLITGILVNQKTKPFGRYIGHFYARRARRILPPYLILLVLVALIFPGPWLRFWYLYIGGMNFLAPLRLAHLDFLSPLWSLGVEEQFYLLWPLAIFFLNRKQVIRCAVALLFLAPVLRFVFTPCFDSSWAVYMLLPFRMDTLAAGALLALLWPGLRERLTDSPRLYGQIVWSCAGVFFLSLLGIMAMQRHGYTTYGNTRLGNLIIYEATLAMMVSVFLPVLIGFGRKTLSALPLVWLGRISYSFYLVHLVVLHILLQFYALPALAVSIVYAAISWIFIEKPLLNSGRPEPAILANSAKL